MDKTPKMRIIELLAGKDVRQVFWEAYQQGESLQKAADIITARYGEPVSFQLLSDWLPALNGGIRSEVVFEGFTPESAGIPPSLAA